MTNPFADFRENISYVFRSNPPIAILDMLIFAVLLYCVFAFLRKHNATKLVAVFVPVLVLVVFFTHAASGFQLLGRVLLYFIFFVFFAAFFIFPQQVRRALWNFSAPKEVRESFSAKYTVSDAELAECIEDIVRTCLNLAKKNIGALLVIVPEGLPVHILESGTAINGKVSSQLLETIFQNKTPLHDGAVVIQGNRLLAASCFLPLSQDNSLDKDLGTRHRAAIGVTENYKAFSVIVSEDTGVISTAMNGDITRYLDGDLLRESLLQVYGLKIVAPKPKVKKRVKGRIK